MSELRCVAANGLIHADGVPPASLAAGLERDPAFVGVDAGSIDGGPHYLGSGENMHASRAAAKGVYRTLLTHTREADVPLIVGSAATAGADAHVEWTREVVREVAAEEGIAFDLAVIYAEQDPDDLAAKRRAGAIEPLGASDPLSEGDLRESERVVAMMGPEPIAGALDGGADVVIAGRCSDVSIFTAPALRAGFPEGPATHLAKTIECGGLIALPRTGADCVVGTLADDAFRVAPAAAGKRTDPTTVASHLLYETADPYAFEEPRGTLDTRDCEYRAVDDRTVEVTGSRFHPAEYTVKLEGARRVGHRAVTVAGIRDPGALAEVDRLVDVARAAIDGRAEDAGIDPGAVRASVRVYGRDGVMGGREPAPDPGHEAGVFVEVVAPTREGADDLVAAARRELLHGDFPGRTTTAGNAAFPLSPTDLPAGEAYEFSVWHSMAVDDPLEPFEVGTEAVG